MATTTTCPSNRQQELALRYPDAPGFKVRGFPKPSPSQDAAIAMAERARTLRAAVLDCMRAHPRTDWTPDEMAAHLGRSILSLRPRYTEMHSQGLIERTGARRPSSAGHAMWTYRIRQTGLPSVAERPGGQVTAGHRNVK